MRSFQVMRHGRRTISVNHDISQSMRDLFYFTSLSKRRNSMSLFPNQQYRDVQLSNGNDKVFRHR